MSWLEEADIAPCGAAGDIRGGGCGKDVLLAYEGVCEHGYIACPECGHEAVCRVCRDDAEREMFRSGTYNAKADPLLDHRAATAARDAARWAQPAWRDLGARPEEDST